MTEELIVKIDELINIFDHSQIIKDITELKKEIYNDKNLKMQLNSFHQLDTNIYNSQYIELKRSISNNPKVSEFKQKENELYFLTLEISKRLQELVKGRNK